MKQFSLRILRFASISMKIKFKAQSDSDGNRSNNSKKDSAFSTINSYIVSSNGRELRNNFKKHEQWGPGLNGNL